MGGDSQKPKLPEESTVEAEVRGLLNNSPCTRCGGLMLHDPYLSLLDLSGQVDYPAWRGVQCGEVVDARILLNRFSKAVRGARCKQGWQTRHLKTNRVH